MASHPEPDALQDERGKRVHEFAPGLVAGSAVDTPVAGGVLFFTRRNTS